MIKDTIKFLIFDPWAIPLLYVGMICSWAYVRKAFLGLYAKAWGFSVFTAIVPILCMFHPATRFLGGAGALLCVIGATMAIIWDNYQEAFKWLMEPIGPKLKKAWDKISTAGPEHENPGY